MRMKKIVSFLLTLVLALGLSISVLAAEDGGSITIDNPNEGVEYTAYKIFDLAYDGENGNYSYTIDSTSYWFDKLISVDEKVIISRVEGLSFKEAPGKQGTYVVTLGENYSAFDLAQTLKAALGSDEANGQKLTKGKIEGLDLGYYLVIGTYEEDGAIKTEALANLTTTNPKAEIHDKNDIPFNKTANDVSVEVGQTVEFKITSKVPDTTGFSDYTYEVSDTMSEGLTFDKFFDKNMNVTVLVGGNEVELTENGNEGNWIVYDGNGFTLSLDILESTWNAGDEILITYKATVNENAVANIDTNTAVLTYSNSPTHTSEKKVETQTYSAKIVVEKYKAGSEELEETIKLPGAEFVLKNAKGNYFVYTGSESESSAQVSWESDIAKATKYTTNENGNVEFKGLEDGTYYLVETKAPNGYNLLTDEVEVVIAGDENDVKTLTINAQVANNTGSILPSTGGMGTTMFYLVGGGLMIGAIVLLVTRRRMDKE